MPKSNTAPPTGSVDANQEKEGEVIRVTSDQAKLLFGVSKPNSHPKRVKKTHDAMPENQVESQCLDFLRAKGWLATRNHVGTFVPYHVAMQVVGGKPLAHSCVVRVGEKGEADWTCVRPIRGQPGRCYRFSLECKAPGAQPSPIQRAWMDKQNALGLLAVCFDSVEGLMDWHIRLWGNT